MMQMISIMQRKLSHVITSFHCQQRYMKHKGGYWYVSPYSNKIIYWVFGKDGYGRMLTQMCGQFNQNILLHYFM